MSDASKKEPKKPVETRKYAEMSRKIKESASSAIRNAVKAKKNQKKK